LFPVLTKGCVAVGWTADPAIFDSTRLHRVKLGEMRLFFTTAGVVGLLLRLLLFQGIARQNAGRLFGARQFHRYSILLLTIAFVGAHFNIFVNRHGELYRFASFFAMFATLLACLLASRRGLFSVCAGSSLEVAGCQNGWLWELLLLKREGRFIKDL